MKATVYAITDEIDTAGNLTLAQIQEMDAAGWAIGNHTKTHTVLTTLTEAQQEAELTGARDALNAWGLTRASRHIAYPNGAYNADTLTAMAATGMLTGRFVAPTAYANPVISTIYEIPTISATIVTATTLATVQGWITAGLAINAWPILLFHGLADTPAAGEWSTANWQALIDWLVAQGIQTKTIVDFYAAR